MSRKLFSGRIEEVHLFYTLITSPQDDEQHTLFLDDIHRCNVCPRWSNKGLEWDSIQQLQDVQLVFCFDLQISWFDLRA